VASSTWLGLVARGHWGPYLRNSGNNFSTVVPRGEQAGRVKIAAENPAIIASMPL
jgi:hypothetical protein